MAMFRRRLPAAVVALLLTLCVSTAVGADPAGQPVSYQEAQYVQVTLGQPDLEEGLRLVGNLPDGLTQTFTDQGGRQSQPNQLGPDRYFYFDVHDTYIFGGLNKVQIAITYRDLGLTPIYLEYDAFDPLRPQSKADDLTRKRVVVTKRQNTEGLKTQFVALEDARFAGGQPGGADFRVYTADDLVLTNVSVLRISHIVPPAPIRVTLDGKPVVYDPNEVQPFIQNGRTLVPMRATFNALGISNENIVWHNETRTVEAKKGATTIALTIDDVNVKVNGAVLPDKLDQPATVVAGRTVVPLRFVATQFGLQVQWSEADRLVILTTAPVPPELKIPEPTKPGTTQPGTTQPGTTQPGTTQPGTTQPGTTRPQSKP